MSTDHRDGAECWCAKCSWKYIRSRVQKLAALQKAFDVREAALRDQLTRAEFKRGQYEERAVAISGLRMDEMNGHNKLTAELRTQLATALAARHARDEACWQRGWDSRSDSTFRVFPRLVSKLRDEVMRHDLAQLDADGGEG